MKPYLTIFTVIQNFDKTMNKILILLLIPIIFTSCKKEKQSELENLQEEKKEIANKKNSIIISLEMPANTSNGINVWLKPYDEFYLEFKNKSDKDSVIIKKLPMLYDYYQMLFLSSEYDENKNFNFIRRYFTANQEKPDLQLKFDSTLIELKNKSSQTVLTNSIYESYSDLKTKHYKNKTLETENYINELDSLNSFFRKLTNNQILNSQINEILYLDEIQKINPKDNRIDEFLKNSNVIITSSALSGLLFNYFKNNAELLNYDNININNYSETNIELLAIGAYRFLKFEDNKGDTKYNKTVSWLKTTDFYKRDSIHIRKKITPINSKKFKYFLNKIELTNINDKKTKVSEIVSESNSKYYLIDFWATWCAPCIQGVKAMNKMSIPKNVKVLSFSVDKEKDKEKWKLKTVELEQELTFWLNGKMENNKGFTKFIEMHSIPRYVLIDKDMNLIDQAFFHPEEPQFLSKLKDIKNHKYW